MQDSVFKPCYYVLNNTTVYKAPYKGVTTVVPNNVQTRLDHGCALSVTVGHWEQVAK